MSIYNLSFRQAKARIRYQVRDELTRFPPDTIWRIQFFIDRIELAKLVFPFQAAVKADGEKVSPPELLQIVRDEIVDFVYALDLENCLEDIEEQVTCPACGKLFSELRPTLCPQCEAPIFFYQAKMELKKLLDHLLEADTTDDPFVKRVLSTSLPGRIQNSYQNLIGILEAYHKRLDTYAFSITGREPIPLFRRNLLQNMQETRNWFIKHHDYDPFELCHADDFAALERVVQIRHLLAHNDGIIDDVFARKQGINESEIGKTAPLNQDEIARAINIVISIVEHAESSFT